MLVLSTAGPLGRSDPRESQQRPLFGGGAAKGSGLIDMEVSEPGFGHRGRTVSASIARASAGVFIAAEAICGGVVMLGRVNRSGALAGPAAFISGRNGEPTS